DRVFEVLELICNDLRDQVVLSHRNTMGLTWRLDSDRFATAAMVDGVDRDVFGSATADNTALARWGRKENRVSTQLETDLSAQALAEQMIEDYGTEPVRIFECTHWVTADSPFLVTSYRAGDVVTIDAVTPEGPIYTHVRIASRTVVAIGGSGRDYQVQI